MTSSDLGWQRRSLGEICSFKAGGAFKPDLQGRSKGEYPFIKVSDMSRPENDRFIVDAANWVSEADCQILRSTKFERGTIVFAKIGEALKANRFRVLTRPTLIDNNMMGAFPRSDVIEPEFLLYLLHELDFPGQAAGSALPYLRVADLTKLACDVPDRREQRRIVWLLSSFADKIENNRRIAETLEQIVATLFKARFVHFVDQDDLVDSEIGQIPRGWAVAAVGNVLPVVGGGTPSTKQQQYWEGGTHCWATPKDLSGLAFPVLLDTGRKITDTGVAEISSKLLPKRTVLLSSRAPIGYTVMSMVEVAVNQGFIAIPPSDQIPSEYILFWLRQNMDRIKSNAGGTTFAEISKRAFRPLPMLVPPHAVLSEFGSLTRPLIDRIAQCAAEVCLLSSIRGSLLPRLISGKVRVPPEYASALGVA